MIGLPAAIARVATGWRGCEGRNRRANRIEAQLAHVVVDGAPERARVVKDALPAEKGVVQEDALDGVVLSELHHIGDVGIHARRFIGIETKVHLRIDEER